jgi:hypothetical protein
MAATNRDAQAGWYIYRASNYSLELGELNEQLTSARFNPVAPRTYTHYRKLHRYGYQRYVPINQLDVETLRDPVWGGPLQTRFRPRPASLGLTLLATGPEGVFALEGALVQLSEVEGTARVRVEGTPVEGEPSKLEGDEVLVVLAGETRAASVELVQTDVIDPAVAEITFAFMGVVSTEKATGLRGLGPSEARVMITTEEEDSPLVVLRQLYSLFGAFDSSRLVCDQALAGLGLADRFTLPPARIKRLSIESPMLIELTFATAPLWVIAAMVTRWEKLRKMHYEADRVHCEADRVRAKTAIGTAKATVLEEKARSLRIRNDKAERRQLIEPSVLGKYVVDTVRSTLPPGLAKPPALDEEAAERVTELTEKQLIPDVETFLDAPLTNVDIETAGDIPLLALDDAEAG